ncbi:MAG TPA: 2-succinyl-5-enolpyruvyl-6-hydroxy-3-cyclohexene-1-carboxylic-acid synthase [Opitutae bacterium]|nr:2-succinyl-5-enolpyruvyl-6-hydroxy-3-cyclohexene-1-carboxylic-acid synthase [Opitutae bacterium]
MNTNALWGKVVARTLLALGLRHAVVSPGSRSTPLASALADLSGLDLAVALDERSAGFHALGIAKATRRPVVLLCTSGTAAANYLPAVIEARLSGIPLLVLTADRPAELRECHSGQTIRQVGIFGTYPVWETETAVPSSDLSQLRSARQTFVDAWQRAQGPLAGPVHLNLPFRDPLAPSVAEVGFRLPKGFDLENFCDVPEPLTLVPKIKPLDVVSRVLGAEFGVIVVGPHAPANRAQLAAAIRELAGLTGWPVLVDGAGTLRGDLVDSGVLVASYDLILRDTKAQKMLRPDAVIRLFDLPTSKTLRAWLADTDVPTVLVGRPGENTDPVHSQWTRLDAELVPGGAGASLALSPLQKLWRQHETKALRRLQKTSGVSWAFEGCAIPLLAEALEANDRLFVGSSMPIRDLEWFWHPTKPSAEIFCNRGANGIDGTVSTALGVARDGRRTFLLCGDLAFLHDGNALLLAKDFVGSLTIVVINNDGGGIFNHLPVASSKNFEKLWGTPQGVSLGKLCSAFGVSHQVIKNWNQFSREVSRGSIGVRVLEVVTNRAKDAAHRQKSFR